MGNGLGKKIFDSLTWFSETSPFTTQNVCILHIKHRWGRSGCSGFTFCFYKVYPTCIFIFFYIRKKGLHIDLDWYYKTNKSPSECLL